MQKTGLLTRTSQRKVKQVCFFIGPKCTKMLKKELFGQLFKLKLKTNILN